MSRSLLLLVQGFCARTGLSVPSSAYGSGDKQVSQIVGLLQEFLDDLYTRRWFSHNVLEATFVTSGAEIQGTMDSIAPYGFEGIVPRSFWDRTARRPVLGSVSSIEWQMRKASGFLGVIPEYRVVESQLRFSPPPPAGHTMAFEYHSSYFIQAQDGTRQPDWQSDTDVFPVSDRLPIMWLRWRWKAEKGLDYSEEFTAYERMLDTSAARDAAPKTVSLDRIHDEAKTGIIVPTGSWQL